MSLSADEPPVLPIGTDVSAKYKGAFCEAKIKKIARNVKCKLTVKQTNHSVTVDDELITGSLRVGSHVSVKQSSQQLDAIVNKILDQSLYTVVFDDGDEATLKRTSLCLKSGKHFAESETLDQLPLTNPEHFGNPVSLGRRRRRRHHNSDSDDDDAEESETRSPPEKDPDWGRVVCVDYGDKRGSKKDIWFPALIVAPTAQDPTTKMTKEEYLVRSFKDGRFYKVYRKDARQFTKEMVLSKSESNSSALRSAMEKAVAFMDKQDLPNHWDYDLLMGNVIPTIEEEVDTSEEFDSALDDSDDEQSEQKDRFVAQLYKYMDERGTPINRAPSVGGKDLNLYKLYRIVVKMGGYNRVTNKNSWRAVYLKLGLILPNTSPGKDSSYVCQLKAAYKKFLHSFDDFYRKLGCTIVVNSRTSRPSRGERVREERTPSSKKNLKKEKDNKKEEPKEEKEIKESTEREAIVLTGTKGKDNDKEKEKEKEKESAVRDEPKPEEPKTVVKETKEKEEVKVKVEDTTALDDRKQRGRGRKKKEEASDEPPADDDTMTGQSTIDESEEEDPKSSHKNSKVDESMIKAGDGLKVKYGRGRQLKVYEAKVLKIELDVIKNKNKYFVHYSGWNSRYDEWIKKSRIVQVLRDRSPRRRSGKMKNKGEPLPDVPVTPPNSGTQNNPVPSPSIPPSMSSQNSVSSVNSNDSAPELTKQSSQPPKRGRPPNSGKTGSIKEVSVKEEPKSQSLQEKQSQPSLPSSQSTSASTPVGRRGRPPLSVKKEKLTRSKSINDDQSTNDSFATSSIADESMNKSIDDKKNSANMSSDNEVSDKMDEKDLSEEESMDQKLIPEPPELHDENTVENRMIDEEVNEEESSVSVKIEPIVEESLNKSIDSEADDLIIDSSDLRSEVVVKSEDNSSPMKDAFDFDDDEEVLKEEEPLKEQLKKKRKTKDGDHKKSNNKNTNTLTEKVDKTKDITNEENTSVRESGRSNSFSRKSTKKARKANVETPVEKPVLVEAPVVEEVIPVVEETPPKIMPVLNNEVKELEKVLPKAVKSLPPVIESEPQKHETSKKRKGRKRKDNEEQSESPAPQKKKATKPNKLELHEEDSNLEVQKLFEQSYSSSTPPPESDVSPVEEMKVLPQFTNDINPSQPDCSVSSNFLICEEAVPASPEKPTPPDEHMDDSPAPHESPHSFHSSPTQSPEGVATKEGKGSGGSNSEMENSEPMVTKDDESHNKMETFPSPAHDEDSMISRPECSKSPISPKKRRRGRIRTVSQSDSTHPKERIGCKTRGSTGRHRAERHSPLTALEHRLPFGLSQISFQNFVPESKYNFCEPLDESIDADKRINILQERLQELRKTYMNIKTEVAVLDRKKKKARRKEREKKDMNNSNCHKHSSNHLHNSNSGDTFHHNLHTNSNNSLRNLNDSTLSSMHSLSLTSTSVPT